MDNEKINNAIKNLDGLSYLEWLKVQRKVNGYFAVKEGEFEADLKLSCNDEDIAILQQFE